VSGATAYPVHNIQPAEHGPLKTVKLLAEKERAMDRNYYYQDRVREQQREIAELLAADSLRREASHKSPVQHRARRLVLRIAPAVILLTVLVLFALSV
jgi:hypothetical protein